MVTAPYGYFSESDIVRRSLDIKADGAFQTAWLQRDGSRVVMPEPMALALAGRVFGCHFGAGTTPLATPATTAIAQQRPQAWLRIPSGRVVIPLSAKITVESAGATTQGEISVAIAQNDVGNGTSSAGTAGPLPLHTGAPEASLCTPRQLATADVTAEVNLLELERFSFAASGANLSFKWQGGLEGGHPVLVGPASFLVYIGGNAVNFFAQFLWIEAPSTLASAT